MVEYIEREAAIAAVKDALNPSIPRFVRTKIALDSVPSADVQPVRHGRWINHGWATVCSECGEDYAFAKRNYCPNCGCRMDGGET